MRKQGLETIMVNGNIEAETHESESEIHLFEPHSIVQNKYFNLISNYKTWIGRPLLRPSGRYRRGHQNYNKLL